MFEYSKFGNFKLQYEIKNNYYQPPVDVIESENNILVRVEIAGMNEDKFTITFLNNILSIFGTRSDPLRNHAFQQMEIHFGDFKIDILIARPIKNNEISAVYTNGFLEVTLQKAQSQNIPINDKDNHY